MGLLLFQKGPRLTARWAVPAPPRPVAAPLARSEEWVRVRDSQRPACLFWVALSRRRFLLGGGGWLERFALLFMLPWPEALPQVTVLIPFLSGPNYFGQFFSSQIFPTRVLLQPRAFTVPLSCL